ncbi:hypothetical protein SAMN05446935_0357 [Burkholderia sp. YR290]|nr:hypothetical protein SAMN05446935_0357 [Burkholderia sp. YR290]
MSGQPTISDVIAELEAIRAKHGDLPVVLCGRPFALVEHPDIVVWDTDWTTEWDHGPMRKVVTLNGNY